MQHFEDVWQALDSDGRILNGYASSAHPWAASIHTELLCGDEYEFRKQPATLRRGDVVRHLILLTGWRELGRGTRERLLGFDAFMCHQLSCREACPVQSCSWCAGNVWPHIVSARVLLVAGRTPLRCVCYGACYAWRDVVLGPLALPRWKTRRLRGLLLMLV